MRKILLLEDQGLVRAGMRELIQLAENDAQIVEVANCEGAMTQLLEHEFEFAFLDIDLRTKLDGRDVLRFIRDHEISVRAVMLSGFSSKDLVLECLNLGAIGFISKDIENDQVFKNVLDTFFQGGIFVPLSRSGDHIELTTHVTVSESMLPEQLGISGRTLEVLVYVCQGYANKVIAKKMNIEEGTIRKDYVPKLFRIFKVTRRTELLIEVSRLGIRLPKIAA